MVSAQDFQVQSLTASGFVAADGFNPSAALRHVLRNWSEVYDGQTTSIPLPPGAPLDFPSVSVSSRDGAWHVEMSRTRVNLVWRRRDGQTRNLGRTFSELAGRLVTIVEGEEASLGRLAALVTRITSVDSPGRVLARQFCRDRWLRGSLNRPEGFELHAHKTFSLLPDLTVNSWVRTKTAKGGSPEYRYVTVEQDINTLAEELETRRFNRRETRRMFAAASRELDAILDMYFPASRR